MNQTAVSIALSVLAFSGSTGIFLGGFLGDYMYSNTVGSKHIAAFCVVATVVKMFLFLLVFRLAYLPTTVITYGGEKEIFSHIFPQYDV
jgi:predicted MFS family arabinose efflux permease